MHLHRISKTVGYISYLRSESKVFVSRNGSFLEERFLSKELSGRVVELDEVIEPSLQPVCSRAQEVFLWRLHQLKWKLMMVIIKHRIKLLQAS